ncbi:aminopeptidase N [Biomphalaria pfeifferi]|uniref:Aminopeptidase N n=1 Tax=Biomphalaria pfeifferi TaxID=112525 RepID=A0AAD8AY95_BIOPF|nr:aminopeptidase N [Biomphalaria pfeifferi]
MPSSKLEFSDMSYELSNMRTEPKGCHVSPVIGFIFVLLAAAIAVGVGIIVHFAGGSRDVVCKCDSQVDEVLQQCMRLASAGNMEICQLCPASTQVAALTTTTSRTTADIAEETTLSSDAESTTSTAPSTSTTEEPVLNVRLPTSVSPLHYNLEIQTYMNSTDPKDFKFKGHVKIWVKCHEETDSITLHSLYLNIDNGSIRFMGQSPDPATDPKYVTYEVDDFRQFLIFRLDNTLLVNRTYVLEMSYTSNISNTLVGLYYSRYSRNGTDVYLATTSFQPTDARKMFPCFDEPAMKASFNVTLVRPIDMISLSNAELLDSRETFLDGSITYVKDVFGQSAIMPTYLLVIAICDFTYLNATTNKGKEFRTYAVPALVNSTKYSLDIGVKILDYLEEFFNISYPLPKLDMIALPDFVSGAMEHWGLISYSEKALLFKEGETNERDKEYVAIVVSHELAHMWFGNLVTMSWWDDLWLNEGFASYVENLGVDYVEPDWKIFDTYVVQNMYTALSNDGLVSSHPLYVPVNHPDEINEIFDSISYSKGAAVVRMMSHFLGFDVFKKGLTKYLETLAYKNAFHDDLWNFMTAAETAGADSHRIDVKEVMDTWILQMNYPVVTVKRVDNSNTQLLVSQARYLADRNATELGKYESPFNYTWIIPLTFTSNSSRNFNQSNQVVYWLWKNESTKVLTLKETLPSSRNGWIIANIDEVGYYRVNYDEDNWKALTDQLQEDHEVIPVINRAQIINDAWNLAKGNYLSLNIAFSTLDYLDKETSYQPWHAVRRELTYMDQMLSLNVIYGQFQRFLRCKLQKPYQYFGLNNTGSSHSDILSRTLIASQACKFGVPQCLQAASEQYRSWMDNPSINPIDTNFRSFVSCYAVSRGDWDEWNFTFTKYIESELSTERLTHLQALSCARQPWILNHYMELILSDDSSIRFHERLNVISNVASNDIGRALAWNFYKTNFKTLKQLYGSSFFSWQRLLASLTSNFNTAMELKELTDFQAQQEGNLSEIATTLSQAIDKVKANIKWMENYQPHIRQIITEKLAQSTTCQ